MLLEDYSALNESYSKYDLFRLVTRDQQRNGTSLSSGLYNYGYASISAFDIYTTTTNGKLPVRFSKFKNVTKAVKTELENIDKEIDQVFGQHGK